MGNMEGGHSESWLGKEDTVCPFPANGKSEQEIIKKEKLYLVTSTAGMTDDICYHCT
jgi:hypothetical protein